MNVQGRCNLVLIFLSLFSQTDTLIVVPKQSISFLFFYATDEDFNGQSVDCVYSPNQINSHSTDESPWDSGFMEKKRFRDPLLLTNQKKTKNNKTIDCVKRQLTLVSMPEGK